MPHRILSSNTLKRTYASPLPIKRILTCAVFYYCSCLLKVSFLIAQFFLLFFSSHFCTDLYLLFVCCEQLKLNTGRIPDMVSLKTKTITTLERQQKPRVLHNWVLVQGFTNFRRWALDFTKQVHA
jgi:hypothetical protein